MRTIMTLTTIQFSIVENILRLTLTAMGASALFFILSRKQILTRFHPSLLIAGLVSLISCYHYFYILHSWNNAFELAGNSYMASGHPFVGTDRYVDWIITTPLLLIEFVLALKVPSHAARWLMRRFTIAAVVMIFSGYLEKLIAGTTGFILPVLLYLILAASFSMILSLLWTKFSAEVATSAPSVHKLFMKARNFITITWLLYPIIDIFSSCSFASGPNSLVAITIAYSLTDIAAKCGLGFYVYQLAITQSEQSES